MSEQEEYKGICNVCGKEEMVMKVIDPWDDVEMEMSETCYTFRHYSK